MSEKEIMSEEAMNELINGFEIVGSLTEYGRKNIKYHFQRLQQENQELKADLEMYENGVYFSSENDKLQNEIDNLNHIIDKQDKDITILSKGNKHLKEVIDKLKEWIYIVQQNKDNKHLEPIISTDELDELLDILKEVE